MCSMPIDRRTKSWVTPARSSSTRGELTVRRAIVALLRDGEQGLDDRCPPRSERECADATLQVRQPLL